MAAAAGISVSNYEVYVDGAASPTALTTSNVWTMTAANGLTTNSTHSFQVDYVTTGRAAFAAVAGHQRHDVERIELGRHSV